MMNKYLTFFLIVLFSSCKTNLEEDPQSEYIYGYNVEKSDGAINALKQIIEVNGEPYFNQYIFFDKNGNIRKEQSHYFTLITVDDTIKVGTQATIRLELDAPKFFNGMKVIVGGFDSEYNNIVGVPQDTLVPNENNYTVFFKATFETPGDTVIRGCILNYGDMKDTDGSTIEIERPLYFSKTIHVVN